MILKTLTVAQPLESVYNVRGNQSFIMKSGFQIISQTPLLYTFKFIVRYHAGLYIVSIFNPLALELDIYSLAHHLCKI